MHSLLLIPLLQLKCCIKKKIIFCSVKYEYLRGKQYYTLQKAGQIGSKFAFTDTLFLIYIPAIQFSLILFCPEPIQRMWTAQPKEHTIGNTTYRILTTSHSRWTSQNVSHSMPFNQVKYTHSFRLLRIIPEIMRLINGIAKKSVCVWVTTRTNIIPN